MTACLGGELGRGLHMALWGRRREGMGEGTGCVFVGEGRGWGVLCSLQPFLASPVRSCEVPLRCRQNPACSMSLLYCAVPLELHSALTARISFLKDVFPLRLKKKNLSPTSFYKISPYARECGQWRKMTRGCAAIMCAIGSAPPPPVIGVASTS